MKNDTWEVDNEKQNGATVTGTNRREDLACKYEAGSARAAYYPMSRAYIH
jgi:hypothetical protein